MGDIGDNKELKQINKVIYYCIYPSPLGNLILGDFENQLCLCCWMESEHREKIMCRVSRLLHAGYVVGNSPLLQQTEKQLEEYFEGRRFFFNLPLCLVGTDFQVEVWRDLQEVAYGTILSYKEQSVRIHRTKAVRAVANADGANALVIVIPCHRIVGSSKSLTGYSGGLMVKRALLKLEAEKSKEYTLF